MSVPFFFFTFVNSWWILLFVSIPFAVRYESDGIETENNDSYRAAPRKIYWKKLLLIVTSLALLISFILMIIINEKIITIPKL
ncbi:MAG: DUF1467 family protein [Rickettsiales bacterium]